jgi:hypothetical protein
MNNPKTPRAAPKIIKHKIGLLNLAIKLGNVFKECKMMGVSRDTSYRFRPSFLTAEISVT